jgi:hypothetical protein
MRWFVLSLAISIGSGPAWAADHISPNMPAHSVRVGSEWPHVQVPDSVISDPQPSGGWAWSILLPGVGQMVLGEPWRGSAFLAGAVTMPLLGYYVGNGLMHALWNAQPVPPGTVSEGNPGMVVFPLGGIALGTLVTAGIWIWSVIDAYGLERQQQSVRATTQAP